MVEIGQFGREGQKQRSFGQKSKFDTRIKVAQFLTLILNLRSTLVNSVGKVKTKGVLASKTWFLASKWVKITDLTDFDHRFGIRIENWTTLILESNFDFWVEIFLSVVELIEKLTLRFGTLEIEHPG